MGVGETDFMGWIIGVETTLDGINSGSGSGINLSKTLFKKSSGLKAIVLIIDALVVNKVEPLEKLTSLSLGRILLSDLIKSWIDNETSEKELVGRVGRYELGKAIKENKNLAFLSKKIYSLFRYYITIVRVDINKQEIENTMGIFALRKDAHLS